MPPRSERILTARGVTALTSPGKYADGGGLYLLIQKGGGRSWVYLYQWNKTTRSMGLGPASSVSLREARDDRDKWREVLKQGKDPIAERERIESDSVKTEEPVRTFGMVARELIDAKRHGWRNAKHASQWENTLAQHAGSLTDKPIGEVDTAAVLAVLKPIWQTKPETASRVRGRIESVIDYADAHGWFDAKNPARWRGHLDKLLSARKMLSRGHHAAMPYKDVPSFMTVLREKRGASARGLEFCILTAARSGEVMGAKIEEFDLEEKVWTVPGNRMKAGREHRVPLSPRAIEIVNEMRVVGEKFLFPGARKDKELSNMAFEMLLRKMGLDATPHGFRSSFRDWAGDCSSAPREVAEAALAHVVGDRTEAAYRRSDALERRRELMNAWADFIDGPKGENVIPLRTSPKQSA